MINRRQSKNIYPFNFLNGICILVLSSFLLSSCTLVKETLGISETTDLEDPEYKESEVFFVEQNYSIDKIEQPSAPEDLIASDQLSLFKRTSIEYEFVYTLEDESLRQKFEQNNILAGNINKENEEEQVNTINAFALEKFVKENEENILTFLQSQGYYSASVHSEIDYDVFPVNVAVEIIPNNEYKIVKADITYTKIFRPYQRLLTKDEEENLTEAEKEENLANIALLNKIKKNLGEAVEEASQVPPLPRTLFEFGLEKDAFAQTEAILEAEKKVLPWFRRHGFPFADIAFTRYFAFQDKKEFETTLRINPKDFVLFGDIVLEGSHALSLEYINRIKTWKNGERWDESKVDQLKNDLFSLGIFSHVSIVPVKTSYVQGRAKQTREEREQRIFNEADEYIVKITLKDSAPRSFGGGFAYNTSRGFGAKLFWEHRNFFDSAENLSLTLDYWEDLQRAALNFQIPDIFKPTLDFNTSLIYEKEVFDAYITSDLTADIGFEQPLENPYFDNLYLAYYLQAVVGNEHDRNTDITDDYYYFGLPITVSTRQTDSALDPSQGYAFSLQFSPYAGEFRDAFSVFQLEATLSAYFELLANKKLVAAFRAKAGALFSEEVNNIPPPLRFYSGGANSVRGYSYQSLGPENQFGEPLGGASLFEASLELRYKLTEDIALVPFLDMGNVYDSYELDFTEDFKFGTGVGLRYYTLAGPLRLDVAVPFDAQNGFNFKDFQIYISIGQAF